MSPGGKRTTIIDVAERARVSAKTVSRVLNGEPHVTVELQERVRAAAEALNYHPNILAQGLVRRRSYLIGLVYENPSPSYVVELQKGVLERIKDERYRMVVIPVRSVAEHAKEVVGLLRSAAIDGVVIAPPASDHPVVLHDLQAVQMPFARIAPTHMLEIGPGTLIDDVTAAREIAAYVIGLGHRDIGIIKGDPAHAASQARMLGYTQAFEEAGLTVRPKWVESGRFSFDSGFEAAQRLLGGKRRPTAILAQNDDMAAGAMTAARDLGLNIPQDLSIVGYDDSEVSRIVWPRLTTVRQPVFEMAVSATDMLLAQLENRPYAHETRHRPEMLLRDSAAPPPK